MGFDFHRAAPPPLKSQAVTCAPLLRAPAGLRHCPSPAQSTRATFRVEADAAEGQDRGRCTDNDLLGQGPALLAADFSSRSDYGLLSLLLRLPNKFLNRLEGKINIKSRAEKRFNPLLKTATKPLTKVRPVNVGTKSELSLSCERFLARLEAACWYAPRTCQAASGISSSRRSLTPRARTSPARYQHVKSFGGPGFWDGFEAIFHTFS